MGFQGLTSTKAEHSGLLLILKPHKSPNKQIPSGCGSSSSSRDLWGHHGTASLLKALNFILKRLNRVCLSSTAKILLTGKLELLTHYQEGMKKYLKRIYLC